MALNIFVAIFVVVVEERWFTTPNEPYVSELLRVLDRVQRSYTLQSHIYSARDREHAYETAIGWVQNQGFEDFNHDGEGDLTALYSIGIHDIQDVVLGNDPVDAALTRLYGVEAGSISSADIDSEGVPRVRSKQELAVFQCSPA